GGGGGGVARPGTCVDRAAGRGGGRSARPAARRPSGAPAIPNARAERKQADKQAAYAALRTLHVTADRQAVDWKLMRNDARPAPCSPCSRPAMAARYRPGPKPRNVARPVSE